MLLYSQVLIFISLIAYRSFTNECVIDSQIAEYVESGKLPTNIKPHDYNLSFSFDKTLSSYRASLSIKSIVNHETDVIILHSDKLSIDAIDGFKYKKGHRYDITALVFKEICFVKEFQFLVLRLKNTLEKDDIVYLAFMFSGQVSSEYKGLTSYTYLTKDRVLKKMITTQFEYSLARTVFPCFDEPHFKAIFNLEISHTLPYESISSSGVAKRTIFDGILTKNFIPTELISPHSLGFVIFDYQYISGVTKSGVYVALYLPDDYITYGDFAMGLILKLIDTYESLLGVKYHSHKIDIVGIQGFGNEAVCSWGLIIFDFDFLLIDEKKTYYISQIQRATRIAFEIAYQWFGHLVTPHCWNDIWLSDAISEYVSHHALQIIHPEYRSFDDLKTKRLLALSLDELKATHSVSYILKYKKSIFLHGFISQYKGAEILGILDADIGSMKFFKCLKKYITEFSHSSADTLKFLSVVEIETGHRKMFYLMSQLTESIGFPLISIEKVEGENKYNISQRRMILTTDIEVIEKASHQFWKIPIYYTTSQGHEPIKHIWLKNKTETINLVRGEEIIQINPGSVYFYRSFYDQEMLNHLARSLEKDVKSFSVADKISLISDAFAMLDYGLYDVKTTFELFEFMKKETDYYVFSTYFDYLHKIAFYTCNPLDPILKYFDYVRGISKSVVDKIGWKRIDEPLLKETQKAAIGYSIILEDEETIEKASDIFEQYLQGQPIDDFEMISVYACGYLLKKKANAVDKIFKLYNSTIDPREAEVYLESFLCVIDRDSIKKILYLTLTDKIPKHDKMKIIMNLNTFYPGFELVKEFIMKEYAKLSSQFPDDKVYVRKYFYEIFSRIKTEDDLNIFKSFLAQNEISESDCNIQFTIEEIKKRITWLSLNLDDFKKYFS